MSEDGGEIMIRYLLSAVILFFCFSCSSTSGISKNQPLLEEQCKIYIATATGNEIPVDGSIIIDKRNCILKFNKKTPLIFSPGQVRDVEKLTIPIPSMKNIVLTNDGASFEFLLGTNKMRFDSDKSKIIVDNVIALQQSE
jgi:hypothetical protein